MGRALLVVDPQRDFIDGSLPVPGAAGAMTALTGYMTGKRWDLAIITLDWHPWNHCSFGEKGGQWPRHCVAYSQGASVWPGLIEAIHASARQVHMLVKGASPHRDEYSVFGEPSGRAAMLRLFQENKISRADICGVAGDICVLETLKDGLGLFGPGMFNVLQEFSHSLDGGKQLAEFCAREL